MDYTGNTMRVDLASSSDEEEPVRRRLLLTVSQVRALDESFSSGLTSRLFPTRTRTRTRQQVLSSSSEDSSVEGSLDLDSDIEEVPEVQVAQEVQEVQEVQVIHEERTASSSPTAKRRRTEDASTLEPVKEDVDEPEEDDGCSICYEDYQSCGEHRLVSLKCGHFFGKSCIMRWIRSEGRSASCPTCKAKATTRDVRPHFTKTFKVLDTSELESLRGNKVLLERRVADLELEVVKQTRLAEELKEKMKNSTISQSFILARRAGKIVLTAITKLSLTREATGYSRAFDYNGSVFAVGVGDLGNLFSAFGIKTLTWENMNLKVRDVQPCHTSRTRVVQFCPLEQTLLLTAGEDKTVIIQDVAQKRVVKKYKIPGSKQVWAGCWISREKLVVGCMDGRVLLYDITSSSELPEKDISDNIGVVPIIFLAYDTRLDLLLICSVKTFVVVHNERVFTLCRCEPGETYRSATWDESSIHVMLSLKTGAGFTHKLYRLGIDEATNVVTMADVDVWDSTNAFKCSTYWYNLLFSTEKGLFSIVYNEDKQCLECCDWTKRRSNVAISFNMGNPSMMLAVPGSNADSKIIFILTELSVFVLNFQIND
ncbi:unnamed protein product [Auanema sp. JU1783]|nr:unnamed protein product [Auanema sp. JU1783]